MQEVFVNPGNALETLESCRLGFAALLLIQVLTQVFPLTGTGVSAAWQLLRSKGILWYGFVVYFSTVMGKMGEFWLK